MNCRATVGDIHLLDEFEELSHQGNVLNRINHYPIELMIVTIFILPEAQENEF